MQIGDIAHVGTGLVLSRKKSRMEYEAKATYKLITLKNISEDGTIKFRSFEEFKSNDVLDNHYFTKEGDILMRLSHPHTAINIGKTHSGLLVPSYFAIIKVDKTKFLPQYIAWYLNSNEVKKELERSQSGSRIPSTNQNVIKTIPVLEANISNQKALMELLELHQKEKELYKMILIEKEKLFKGIAHKIINKLGEST